MLKNLCNGSLKKQGEIEMASKERSSGFLECGMRTITLLVQERQNKSQLLTDFSKNAVTPTATLNPAKVPKRPDTDLAGLTISALAEKTTMKSEFCMLIGELMYMAMNTRPEIGYAEKSRKCEISDFLPLLRRPRQLDGRRRNLERTLRQICGVREML